MARVLLGVRGMNNEAAVKKVEEVLSALEGVNSVQASTQQQAAVEYDDGELTTMDLIRSLRRLGFAAGME